MFTKILLALPALASIIKILFKIGEAIVAGVKKALAASKAAAQKAYEKKRLEKLRKGLNDAKKTKDTSDIENIFRKP